jgi:hypothetical protein
VNPLNWTGFETRSSALSLGLGTCLSIHQLEHAFLGLLLQTAAIGCGYIRLN